MGLDKRDENLENVPDDIKNKKDINSGEAANGKEDIKVKEDTDAKEQKDTNGKEAAEDKKSKEDVNGKKDIKSKKDVKGKKGNKKKKDKKIVLVRVLLISMMLLSLGNYFFDRYRYYKETKRIEALKEAALKRANEEKEKEKIVDTPPIEEDFENIIEEPEEDPYVSPIDFEYWRGINPDVIAYIKVPGTNIDYPILYDAEDNLRYLHESIDGEQTVHGSIYLDQLASPDFTGKNNLIYGHHMKDGSMFKDVVKYKDEKYLKKHKTVYIYLPDREIKLRAVAAFYGEADGSSRQVRFSSDEKFTAFVESRLSNAKSKAKLPAGGYEAVSQLFCLVTCSYEFNNARTFLYCVNESDYDTDTGDIIGDTDSEVNTGSESPTVSESTTENEVNTESEANTYSIDNKNTDDNEG